MLKTEDIMTADYESYFHCVIWIRLSVDEVD